MDDAAVADPFAASAVCFLREDCATGSGKPFRLVGRPDLHPRRIVPQTCRRHHHLHGGTVRVTRQGRPSNSKDNVINPPLDPQDDSVGILLTYDRQCACAYMPADRTGDARLSQVHGCDQARQLQGKPWGRPP